MTGEEEQEQEQQEDENKRIRPLAHQKSQNFPTKRHIMKTCPIKV